MEFANLIKRTNLTFQLRTGSLVLVMELVNGGSVLSMLESAEYKFGLTDDLMIALLRDVG